MTAGVRFTTRSPQIDRLAVTRSSTRLGSAGRPRRNTKSNGETGTTGFSTAAVSSLHRSVWWRNPRLNDHLLEHCEVNASAVSSSGPSITSVKDGMDQRPRITKQASPIVQAMEHFCFLFCSALSDI